MYLEEIEKKFLHQKCCRGNIGLSAPVANIYYLLFINQDLIDCMIYYLFPLISSFISFEENVWLKCSVIFNYLYI